MLIANSEAFRAVFDRRSKPLTDLASIDRRDGSEGLHVVSATGASASEDLFKVLTRSKTGLALDAEAAGKPPFNLTAASKLAKLTLPVGRGFLISSAKASMLQISTPYEVPSAEEVQDVQEITNEISRQLDEWVERIVGKWGDAPRWTFEISAAPPPAEKSAAGGGAKAAAPAAPKGPQVPEPFVAKLRDALKALGMIPEKDLAALDTLGVVNAAAAMDDLIDWSALAVEAGLQPEDLVVPLVTLGYAEADARKQLGLKVEPTAEKPE